MTNEDLGFKLFGYNMAEVNEVLSRIDREYAKSLKDHERDVISAVSDEMNAVQQILESTLKSSPNRNRESRLESDINRTPGDIYAAKDIPASNNSDFARLETEKSYNAFPNPAQVTAPKAASAPQAAVPQVAARQAAPAAAPAPQAATPQAPIVKIPDKKAEFWGTIPKIEFLSLSGIKSDSAAAVPNISTDIKEKREISEKQKVFIIPEPKSTSPVPVNDAEALAANAIKAGKSAKAPKAAPAERKRIKPVEPPKEMPQENLALAGKYILGKLAGEDLYDLSGNIIVEKHREITEDIIVSANKASKLSELIVNMTIPDLPEITE